MPYLSQLIGSRVKDSAETVIGKLEDILIRPRAGEYLPLEFLAVAKRGAPGSYIPYEFVENLGRETTSLKNPWAGIPAAPLVPDDFVYLKRDVLDQQIVDVKGVRVVRVNDLRIGAFEGKMSLLGIDVSTKGLLRRLGLEWLDVFNVFKVRLINWRETNLVQGSLQLAMASKKLQKLHPADLANIVEELSVRQGSKLVGLLDARAAAKVLEEVNPHVRQILVKYLGAEKAADIVAQMSVDEIVDLVKKLPRREARTFLDHLQNGRLQKIENLLRYPDNTAGGLMTVEFVAVRPKNTVAETIEEIKTISPALRSLLYVYVTDEDGTLHGTVSLRWLLVSPPEKKMGELIKTFPMTSTLKLNQKIENIAAIMTKYNLFTAAVVDDAKKLVGVVTIDDVMRRLVPRA